mgnify:CR=1 FL=1
MDSAEFAEWQAMYSIEPWGDRRGDIQAALVSQQVHNSVPRKGPPAKLNDFMIEFEVKPQPTPQQLAQKINDIFKGLAAAAK